MSMSLRFNDMIHEQCRCSDKDEGFSLIEMLVVLAILALSGLLASSFLKRPGINESPQQVIREMKNMFEVARLEAIQQGVSTDVVVDLETNIIGRRRDENVSLTFSDALYVKVKTGLQLIEADTRASIRFFPDGTSTGGSIIIEDRSGNAYDLTVHWLTGKISAKHETDGR